jgi:hypothetical protein
MPEKFQHRGSAWLFLLEAEMHNFRRNSWYAYANVVNFGEHDLHNIPHNFGIQHKAKFDHNNPNSFIET